MIGITGANEASHVVVLDDILCKQRDPHPQIEFDFHEKQIH